MENVRHCRAMGSLFRQFAVFDPVHSWKYLIEAQKWEHLADAEIASHFKECNITESKAPELRPAAEVQGEPWAIKRGATVQHLTI
jgi:hypothetical protein